MSILIVLFVLHFLQRAPIVQAKEVDVCVCSPMNYQWSIDLNATCDSTSIMKGAVTGIRDFYCNIYPKIPTVTDLVPVIVTEVSLYELSTTLGTIKTGRYRNSVLNNGDLISFKSSAEALSLTPDRIPGGLFMRITSQNSAGEVILNDWILDYTNNCETEPFEGLGKDRIGWAVFVSDIMIDSG